MPAASDPAPPVATPAISSVAELLIHAHALEQEAVARYNDLAAELEDTNAHLAALFRRMAAIEAKHVAKVDELADDLELPSLDTAQSRAWPDGTGPETVDTDAIGAGSTEAEALNAMIALERTAAAFFRSVAEETADSDVRALARELADEEQEHIELLTDWLARLGAEPGAGTP